MTRLVATAVALFVACKSAPTTEPTTGGPCTSASDCRHGSGELGGCLGPREHKEDGTVGPGRCVQLARGERGSQPCLVTRNATVHPGDTPFDQLVSSIETPPGHAFFCDVKDGVVCDWTSGACKALGKTGQPCTQGFECLTEDFCAVGSNPSTCKPRIAEGASCQADRAAAPCKAGSFCDAKSYKCTPVLPDGAPCADVVATDRTSACKSDSYCDSVSNRCKPMEKVGAPCSFNAMCAEGCRGGRCSPPPAPYVQ